jgi:hypothetical protein
LCDLFSGPYSLEAIKNLWSQIFGLWNREDAIESIAIGWIQARAEEILALPGIETPEDTDPYLCGLHNLLRQRPPPDGWLQRVVGEVPKEVLLIQLRKIALALSAIETLKEREMDGVEEAVSEDEDQGPGSEDDAQGPPLEPGNE